MVEGMRQGGSLKSVRADPAGPGARSGTQLLTALIVEPDADTRLLYRTALAPIATTLIETDDGAEALGRAIAERPDVIVMELRLPRVDGAALCSLLRGDPATAHIRLVVVTGETPGSDNIRAAAAADVDAVLGKPCDIDELVATVKRVCSAPAFEDVTSAPAAEESATSPRKKSRRPDAHFTTSPPRPAPHVFCPRCTAPLTYRYSYTGGVSARFPEQWDYFTCAKCGTYRYRHRTRRLTPAPEPSHG
jgi:CheY-like chemotaxis protein